MRRDSLSADERRGSPRAVCILGMHRSGTSCLAGSLEEAGLALGDDVITEAPHNRKGNRENPRIMALHEEILESNGGSWHTPPKSVSWSSRQRRERDEIISAYRRFPVWGFKDPRTLLLVAGWRDALPHLRFIGTFRHPLAVARSLRARNGFSLERGMELWSHYNRLLLDHQARLGFDLVAFDLEPAGYQAAVSKAARRLGLSPPAGGFAFYEPRLRHHESEGELPLPPAVAAIHHSLVRVASFSRGRTDDPPTGG